MIFATSPTQNDLLLSNMLWYHDNLDLILIEKQTNDRALEVQMTFCDMLPYRPKPEQVKAFNRACELYREVSLVRKLED